MMFRQFRLVQIKSGKLRQDILYDFALHVGEAESPTLVSVSQPLVIDAHQVEQGRLKIMYVDGVFYNIIAEVIRLSVTESGFHACSGHPHGETAGMMVAAIVIG